MKPLDWPVAEQRSIIMTTQQQTSGKKPTHRVFTVEGEGKQANWIEIGAAWTNQDGEGYSLSLGAIPLNGRIVMRKITERKPMPAEEN
jgi:uncharacterized protein (DUF736 family)